jgi:hypothetical protein
MQTTLTNSAKLAGVVSREEIAQALGYSPAYGARLLLILMRRHGFPAPLPGMARWSADAVNRWIASAQGAPPRDPFADEEIFSDRVAVPGAPLSSPETSGLNQATRAPAGIPPCGVPASASRRTPAHALRRAFQVVEGGRHV